MTISSQTRTLEIAVSEVRYGIEFGRLNERLWMRADTVMAMVQVVTGALALAGAFAGNALALQIAGGVLALVSGVQLTLQPIRRSMEFRAARRAFHALAKQAWQIGLDAVDAQLEDLRADAPQGLDALAKPALNAMHAQIGAGGVPLSLRERMALALA